MKDIIAALFTDSSIRLGKVYKYKISKVSQNRTGPSLGLFKTSSFLYTCGDLAKSE